MTAKEEVTHADRPAPTVFISYSHDSPDHKMWVARLATDLRTNGADAILDQWDLRLGQDAAVFMERGIGDSNRVLMICTPEYARKAEAGEGGVGYEKMIVTGEIYENIGSEKFIPVIRRGKDRESRPSFLKTKMYADFREDETYAASLEQLLRALHEVPSGKPPLGKNPFVEMAGVTKNPALVPIQPALIGLPDGEDITPESVYRLGHQLLRQKDFLGWRDVAKRVRRRVETDVLEWLRQTSQAVQSKRPETIDQFLPYVWSALEEGIALMVLGLVGVDSRMPEVNDQRAVVDDLLNLPRWPRGGLTPVIEIPQTLVYVYHHLHGAVSLQSGQQDVALRLATMEVPLYGRSESSPLWRVHGMTGWPSSLGGNCAQAWAFLGEIPKRCPVLAEFFVRENDFTVALWAYNALLFAVDLATGLKTARERRVDMVDVPPMFLNAGNAELVKAVRLAFKDRATTSLLTEYAGITPEALKEAWPAWCEKATPTWRPSRLLHANVPALP